MKKKNFKLGSVLSVALLLFAAHAGGGFATGNQVNTYFVNLGWTGLISIAVLMLILMSTIGVCIAIYNKNNFSSYKEVFDYVFHPYEKLTFLFELFFTVMVLMVISSSVSGSASAISSYFTISYIPATIFAASIILILTILGADFVRKVGSIMGIVILVASLLVYAVGTFYGENIFSVLYTDFKLNSLVNFPKAILTGILYAGFQCVQIPGMLPCSKVLKSKEDVKKSMKISYLINTLALVLSFNMLLSWEKYYTSIENGSILPTLTSINAIGYNWMIVFYAIILILCLISSAVSITFGLVNRFENKNIFLKVKNIFLRRFIIAFFVIVFSSSISTVGLTNVVKYGYGYCGYLGILTSIVPILTVGVYKLKNNYNKDFIKERFNNELETA